MNNPRPSIRLSLLLALIAALMLSACSGSPSPTSGAVTVEIVFLNHPTIRKVLTQVDSTLAAYGDKVNVTRYDFDTPEGEAFAEKKSLSGHVPLAIFVNGSQTFDLNGRKVTFESFPEGAGTGVVPDGAWTVADLDAVLKSVVGK